MPDAILCDRESRPVFLVEAEGMYRALQQQLDQIAERQDRIETKLDRFFVSVEELKSILQLQLSTSTEAMKSLRGRPKNSEREAGVLSQRDMAEAFGRPCTKMMVYNWEKGRTLPPSGEYNGRLVSYDADLRLHPTAKNKLVLAAIIEEYKSRQAVRQGVKDVKFVHFKSEETLAAMRKIRG